MLQSVIFDMDGVIFDTERVNLEAWRILAEKYALPEIDAVYRQTIGVTAAVTRQILLKAFGENFPVEERLQEIRALTLRLYPDRAPIKKGVRELLTFLARRKIPAAIASSSYTEKVSSLLEGAGLKDFFSVIAGGDTVEKSKPEPDIFLKAAGLLQTERHRSLVIEDSYNGVLAAKRAGIPVIMVPDLLPPTEEMKNLAEKILPDLLSVKEYIEKI